jgi:hypothetical protein
VWLYAAVKQLSPGCLVVWLVLCMMDIVIIAVAVFINLLVIVNYAEADTGSRNRDAILIEAAIILIITSVLTGSKRRKKAGLY